MNEKHFLEKGDMYMFNWLSTFGSEEESDKQIMKIIKAILKLKSKGYVITKIIGYVAYYNPYDDEDTCILNSTDNDKAMLIGFLEGSSVNQNMAAHPISKNYFESFKHKLLKYMYKAKIIDNSLLKNILDYDYNEINNILSNNKIPYEIKKDKDDENYIVWKIKEGE